MLPKIDVPIHELVLPSTGQTLRFRPFLVKEEKILLMATEADDAKDVVKAIQQIIRNCMLDEVDIENLPLYDIEFMFLNLRARSVSEIVDLKYNCFNQIPVEDKPGETKQCGGQVSFKMDLLEIRPVTNPDHTNKIEVNEKLGLVMKYPNFELLNSFNLETKDHEKLMDMIVSCIDYIYDADNIFYAKDSTKKELLEFVEGLPSQIFGKVQKFFETMPKLKKDLDFRCPKCGYHENITVEGVQNFFG
jgi:hypothetical protein